ncbi:hypothetical protein GCE86_08840 [Micromonospora terminaliae]|uniref:Uncharacterized protein n=1 Tax=Micromonospora terminaliae TaxID=1914461 RepID=A0ABX6DZN2_9ACTN|nr:hypothetical protein [Micromonospora terminaliae]QGL47147.1 hypothetical protein GCE86_08840 [Micromonospora terminaliae]
MPELGGEQLHAVDRLVCCWSAEQLQRVADELMVRRRLGRCGHSDVDVAGGVEGDAVRHGEVTVEHDGDPGAVSVGGGGDGRRVEVDG